MPDKSCKIIHAINIIVSVSLIITFAVLYAEFDKSVKSYHHVPCKVVNKTIEDSMCLKTNREFQCGCFHDNCNSFISEHKNGTCCSESCCMMHNKPAGQSGRYCVAYSSHKVSVKWYKCKKVILDIEVGQKHLPYSYKCGMYNKNCLSKFDNKEMCYYNGRSVRFSSPNSDSKKGGYIAGMVIFSLTLLSSIIVILYNMYKDGKFDEVM